MRSKMEDESTYPFSNVNGSTIEVISSHTL